MAQAYEPRKSIRVIPASTADRGQHRTVNIRTAKLGQHAEFLQVSAANAMKAQATVKDSGGAFAGLPTICIQGYAAPN